MSSDICPQLGIPIPPDTPYITLRERAEACCNTVSYLQEQGLPIPQVTEDDIATAQNFIETYAADPDKAEKMLTTHNQSGYTHPSLLLIQETLKTYGTMVAEDAAEIRALVTNKLLLETENKNPSIRLRALEMLGKISDVGLFSEKSEITVTHQSTEDLRRRLRDKLHRLNGEEIEVDNVEDAEVVG